MLAAILTLCGTMTALTSCSDSNDKVTPVDTNQLAGGWFSAYDVAGTVTGDTDGEEIAYDRVLQAYQFREDGTGKWQKF